MIFLKILGIVWLSILVLSIIGYFVSNYIEQKLDDTSKLKKWWRANIAAPDPEDENIWKNFNG